MGTLEHTSAPPEAKGPALCPCVCLTVGCPPQTGGVGLARVGRLRAVLSLWAAPSSAWTHSSWGIAAPLGAERLGGTPLQLCTPPSFPSNTKPRRWDLVTEKLMVGEEN